MEEMCGFSVSVCEGAVLRDRPEWCDRPLSVQKLLKHLSMLDPYQHRGSILTVLLVMSSKSGPLCCPVSYTHTHTHRHVLSSGQPDVLSMISIFLFYQFFTVSAVYQYHASWAPPRHFSTGWAKVFTVMHSNICKYICATLSTINSPSEPLNAAGKAVAPSKG